MASKPAYQCNHQGLYVDVTEADESPLEPGIFHVPAGATLTPPPDEWPAGKWPRWNGSKWDLVNAPKQVAQPTAAEKLAAFLAQNPDVAAMIEPATTEEIPQEEGAN